MDSIKRSITPEIKFSVNPDGVSRFGSEAVHGADSSGNNVGSSSNQEPVLEEHAVVELSHRTPPKKKVPKTPSPVLRRSLRIFNMTHSLGCFTIPTKYLSLKEATKNVGASKKTHK
ncbi:hypothetical protein PGT21_033981 [Puccinia graminis f. sp. tritici]|uniref:Uncharacterized protein n=1 Tax=Puccinia graminis f. sp. tritici TaxID=56615 RepID=A0A5B0MHB6_PUCGR|nr:hypothetical protein PGTUg99_035459 [Puccinia graminis f. sp. tritici]KAA1091452.1 hypothetical protein PGT21_033981 [Puccinia graminis f. sp. tritici]